MSDAVADAREFSAKRVEALGFVEKLEYVAQIISTLALMLAALFGWLGWRENRLARQAQNTFFVAQNAPDLKPASLDVTRYDGRSFLNLRLLNSGGSPARIDRISLITNETLKPIRDTSTETPNIFVGITVPKGHDQLIIFDTGSDLKKALGWTPGAARVFRFNDRLNPNEYVAGLLEVEFSGPLGDHHGSLDTIAMTAPAPPPSKELSIEPASQDHFKR